eukprot:COSAG05_NODE_171_length_15032_cov_41.734561_2_plen_199_part_00
MCPGSPMQLCKMMCPQPNCPAGQCAMRQGRCCSMKCQSTSGAADKGEYNDGQMNDGPPRMAIDPGFGFPTRPSPPPPAKKGLQACLQCIGKGMYYGQNGMCATSTRRFPTDGFGICGGSHSSTSRCCRAILKPHKSTGMWGRTPGKRGSGSGGVRGARCVKGFSESGIKMPCASGLQCVVPADMMCAGTCYGRCAGGH